MNISCVSPGVRAGHAPGRSTRKNLLPFMLNKIVLLSIAVLRLIELTWTQSTGVRSRSFAGFSFSSAGARVEGTLVSNTAPKATHNADRRLVRVTVPPVVTCRPVRSSYSVVSSRRKGRHAGAFGNLAPESASTHYALHAPRA